MVRPVYMAGVLGLGGLLGFGLGWTVWGQPDEPDAIVSALLEERCLPHILGEVPETDDLTEANIANATGYVESDRHIVIMFGENKFGPRCIISDILAQWSKPKRDAVLEITGRFAALHIAPLNDGSLVKDDVSSAGLGDPQIVWRRPDLETGFFAMFTHTSYPGEHVETTVQLGVSKFIRPAQISEGSDA